MTLKGSGGTQRVTSSPHHSASLVTLADDTPLAGPSYVRSQGRLNLMGI